jgi:xanthine dehydrogenase accessory factor
MTAQGDDIDVVEGALAWLQSDQQVALATVTKTWGSSPRPPGSLMVMNKAGQFIGSVSGGCVEDSLLSRYSNGELAGPTPTLLDFGVDTQEASRLGLPCGGRLEVLIEHLDQPHPIKSLLTRMRQGELVTRSVDLVNGATEILNGDNHPEFQLSETNLLKTFGPAWQLLLIGDGQLARHLASMALQLDYRVTICDPREGFVSLEPLADVNCSRAMPDDAVKELTDQSRTAIVTLAHDPRQDDLGLSAALESQAFYIGALGSKRSAQARRTRLTSLGYSAEQIGRIHGPAGLHIGSKRPAEIAVSILAQITAIRNGITAPVQQQE